MGGRATAIAELRATSLASVANRGPSSCGARDRQDRRVAPETPDGAVDAEERLPDELGDDQDVHHAGLVPPVEQDTEVAEQEQRSADEPEPGHAARNEPGLVHEVAED